MRGKTTKTEYRYFAIPEWEKEERYLQERHRSGWRFTKATGLGRYHFEKCEPQDVVYQLDYNQEGIAHKEEYVQMFRDCGWEYLQDFYGYSYFRKPVSEMNGEEKIFCDEESRIEMMKRVFRGRIIPLLLILFLVIIPQTFIQHSSGHPVFTGIYSVTCYLSGIAAGFWISVLEISKAAWQIIILY